MASSTQTSSDNSPLEEIVHQKTGDRVDGAACKNISHTTLIQTAVNCITANQETVSRGVQDVVQDHHQIKRKTKTVLRYIWHGLGILVLGVLAILIEYYFPQVRLYLAILVLTLVLVLAFYILMLYVRYGKSHYVISKRLINASKYLDVCQVSEHYTKLMIPNLSPQVQQVCHCQLAGSSGDSFGFFPSYSANVSKIKLANLQPFTQDVDMNLFYDAVALNERNLMDIGQPGFCWVQISETDLSEESFIRDCLVEHRQTPGKYLSGRLVSEKIASLIPTNRDNVEYNYPAITCKSSLKGPQGKYRFDIDVVFGIKLCLWPAIAKDWPSRVVDRLPTELIDTIYSNGCYIVHKHCNGDQFNTDHDHHNLDWRITFAEGESMLFKHHSSKKALKLCYVILKFVLKNYIMTSKKSYPALKSYHLKTVFLWLAEEGQKSFDFTEVEHNQNLAGLFLLLIKRYQEALENNHLPHYFMPSVNIIAQYSNEDLKNGVKVLEEFQGKPIYLIEAFTNSWINQRMLSMIFVTLVIVLILSVIASFYFRVDQETRQIGFF